MSMEETVFEDELECDLSRSVSTNLSLLPELQLPFNLSLTQQIIACRILSPHRSPPLACRVVSSSSTTGLSVSPLLVLTCARRCRLCIYPRPIKIYKLPGAKFAVIDVPLSFNGRVSLSAAIKKLLLNSITAEQQQFYFPFHSSDGQLSPNSCFCIRKLGGFNNANADNDISFFRITRSTQILLEMSYEPSKEIQFDLFKTVFPDVHNQVRGCIISCFRKQRELSERLAVGDDAISTVLMAGQLGSKNSLSEVVAEEASNLNVPVVRISLAELLHVDEDEIKKKLCSYLLIGETQESCIFLINDLDLTVKSLECRETISLTYSLSIFLKLISSEGKKRFLQKKHYWDTSLRKCSIRSRSLIFGVTESFQNLPPLVRDSFEDTISISGDLSKETLGGELNASNCQSQIVKSIADVESSDLVLSSDDMVAGIQDVILIPRFFPRILKAYNIIPPTGVLLFGPSGTGKTLLAKIIAKRSKSYFVNIKLSDVISGSIGEASHVLRRCFDHAKKKSPSIIFIDEFQALFVARNDADNNSKGGGDTSLIYTLIECLDHVMNWNSSAGPEFFVTVLGASNEPWAVDEILLRPGRFDRVIFVGPLSQLSRSALLKKLAGELTEHIPWNVNTDELLDKTNGFSGADIKLLFQKACAYYFEHVIDEYKQPDSSAAADTFSGKYFDAVLQSMTKSVSEDDVNEYTKWSKSFNRKL